MRGFLLIGVSVIALSLAAPARAQSSVYCTNCATLAQELQGYARQLLQLEQEMTIAKNAVANTIALPSTVYRNMSGDVQQVLSIANQANMLNGDTRAMLDRLAGATGYPTGSLSQWQNRLITQDVAISQAMMAAAKILDQQQTSLKTNSATLDDLHTQAMGTTGQQATLQSLAGIQATVGQSIQSQQATSNAAMQAMLTYQAAQADRDAYARKLLTLQQEAGSRAACANISSLGFPLPPTCTGSSK